MAILPKLSRTVQDPIQCDESRGQEKLILKYLHSGAFMKPEERKGQCSVKPISLLSVLGLFVNVFISFLVRRKG